MSTYLVAFVFCDYVPTTRGRVTVWSRENRRNNTAYALEVADRTLDILERKLEIQCPPPKLDMVEVPYQSAPSMGNWGLIICSEAVLLTPENKSEETSYTHLLIAETVSHDIAHQWFGNLVTVKWWSDLWLNKGITGYMEDLVISQIVTKWYQVDRTVLESPYLYEPDCRQGMPIWRPVRNSEEISDIFSTMSYKKGAMVTRMAHQILGDEAFWRGIRRYLLAKNYESVEESDFWQYLTGAQLGSSGRLDMEEIMYPWTHLPGMPIVTTIRDYNGGKVFLSQHSCLSDEKEHQSDLWNIPMVFKMKHSDNLFRKIIWLRTRNATVERLPDKGHWITINSNAMGHYIVNYDSRNWNLLSQQMLSSHTIFEPTERFKLLSDIAQLTTFDKVEIDVFSQHLLYIGKESDLPMLTFPVMFIQYFLHYFEEEEYYELMKEFAIHILKSVYDRYAWPDEITAGKQRRVEFFLGLATARFLCQIGYTPCVKQADSRYGEIKNKTRTWVREYDWIALCVVAGNATLEEWNSLRDQYMVDGPDPLSYIIFCANDPAVIQRELKARFSITDRNLFTTLVFAGFERKVYFDELLKFADHHFGEIPEKDIELGKMDRITIRAFGNARRNAEILLLLRKHLWNSRGSKAKNIEKVIKFFDENLSKWERKEQLLKRWLDETPWRSG